MCASRHSLQVIARLSFISGLTQRPAIQNHIRVAGDHQIAASFNSFAPSSGVLDHLDLRIPARQLVNAGNDDLELHAQLAKNLASLRRSGCEDDVQDSSGNQMAISRSADSSESEPWTMLKVTSSA